MEFIRVDYLGASYVNKMRRKRKVLLKKQKGKGKKGKSSGKKGSKIRFPMKKRKKSKRKKHMEPLEPLVFHLHWKFEFFFFITLAIIFAFGLNPPAILILLFWSLYIYCTRKTLVLDWQEGVITCGRTTDDELFNGKISDLVSVVLFEKHYKEGREQ